MKRIILTMVLAAAAVTTLPAQAPPAAGPKQPMPKTQKELDALKAMFGAQTPDARIQAAQNLITNFADTDFKALALYMEATAYQQKGDYANAVAFGKLVVKTDPKNYQALYLLAELVGSHVRENDLNLAEEVAEVQGYVKQGEETLAAAPKPNPQLTDEQWASAKKDMQAQGHSALGRLAMAQKKYDVAAQEFDMALKMQSQPDPRTYVMMADAYTRSGKWDEAIAAADKAAATPNVHPQIKQVAEQIKSAAEKNKASGAKPKTTTTPGQVEIK